jgi:hypothetical protein
VTKGPSTLAVVRCTGRGYRGEPAVRRGARPAGPARRESRHVARGGTSRRLGARSGLGKARAASGGARRGCLGRPARGRRGAGAQHFGVPLFDGVFLQIFQLKCAE